MHTVAVVQARMGSSRLPGKVLRPLAGHPMLYWLLMRAARATLLDDVVVATTHEPEDDLVESRCTAWGFRVVRGERFDVLRRVVTAAQTSRADEVVRLTADCPLIDPALIDAVVRLLREERADFAANRLPPPATRQFPIGLDVEAATMQALAIADREAVAPHHREHVMPFLYESGDRFSVRVLGSPEDAGDVRWTVDTLEDVRAVEPLLIKFGEMPEAGWQAMLEHWRRTPRLAALNAHVTQKSALDVDHRSAER